MKIQRRKGNKLQVRTETTKVSKKGRTYKRRKWQTITDEIALES